jgi:integral membrane protein (TIGR01906 family)
MRLLAFVVRWLFIICIPILPVTASVGWAVNSLWLYEHGFEEYHVSLTTGLADTELDKAARGLISYINCGSEDIDITVEKDGKPFPLLNQREIIHMRDLKALVWLDYRLAMVTLIYALAYGGVSFFWHRPQYWRQLAKSVAIGSSITLAILLALCIGTLLNFEQLLLQFHLISFSNDFWQLDPSRDYLIMLFPEGFWYDFTLFVALAASGMALVLGGLAGGYLFFKRKGDNVAKS